MTSLEELGKARFKYFIDQVGKYSRLIINDHFSVILMVLLAFGAIYYRDLLGHLQTLQASSLRLPVIIVATGLIGGLFQMGHPMWFTKQADRSYLFAQGQKWHPYWFKWVMSSLFLPFIYLALGSFLVYPFLKLVSPWVHYPVWLFIALVWLMKVADYLMVYLSAFDLGLAYQSRQLGRSAYSIIFTIILFISCLLPKTWDLGMLILPVAITFIYFLWAFQNINYYPMQFDYVVALEAKRQATFYRWVSIFADVPTRTPSIRRLPWMDYLIQPLSKLYPNRFYYLYLRLLVRNSAYASIWLKILIFIAFLLLFTNSSYLLLGLGILSSLMTIIQLLPLIHTYDYHPFQRIYPHHQKRQVQAFQITMLLIFGSQLLAYSLVLCLSHLDHLASLWWIIPVWLLVDLALIYFYVPWWYQKNQTSI